MSKSLVETTGDFILVDTTNGAVIYHDRPTVVEATGFTHTRLHLGQLKLISADLRDECTDEEFEAAWRGVPESPELVIEAFLSEFASEGPSVQPSLPFTPDKTAPVKTKG